MKKEVGIAILGIAIASVLVSVVLSNVVWLGQGKFDDVSLKNGIPNPFQTYQINSECELAYTALTNIENNDPPFPVDNEYLRGKISDFQQTMEQMSREGSLDFESSENLFVKGKQITVEHIIEYNSINPELRDSVETVLYESFFEDNSKKQKEALEIMYLTKPSAYKDDPRCGQKFHADFGEQTFAVLEEIYGKEEATNRYQKIKETIYS